MILCVKHVIILLLKQNKRKKVKNILCVQNSFFVKEQTIIYLSKDLECNLLRTIKTHAENPIIDQTQFQLGRKGIKHKLFIAIQMYCKLIFHSNAWTIYSEVK